MVTNTSTSNIGSITGINKILSFIDPAVVTGITVILILLIGFTLGRIAQKLVAKLLYMADLNKHASKRLHVRFSLEKLLSTLVAYAIYVFTIIMVLNRIGITKEVITTAAIIIAIVLILFFVFGVNDILTNFFAGIAVRFRKNIKPGEYIIVKEKDVEGIVVQVTAFHIRIETGKDEFVFIPHMVILKSQIIRVKEKDIERKKNGIQTTAGSKTRKEIKN